MSGVCLCFQFHLNRELLPGELRSLEAPGTRWDSPEPHVLEARTDMRDTFRAEAHVLRQMYLLIEQAGLEAHEYGPQGVWIEPRSDDA